MKEIMLNKIRRLIDYDNLLTELDKEINIWSYEFTTNHFKHNQEDILQEARLVLWKTFNDYVFNEASDFKTYFYKRLKNRLLNLSRKMNEIYSGEAYGYEEVVENEPEKPMELLSDLQFDLNKNEKLLLKCLTEKTNIKEFCQDNNLEYQQTIRKINKLKEKLKEYVKER